MAFKPAFIDNAVNHMNEDHRDAMVDMLHGLCQAPWVTDAEMLHFDASSIRLRGWGAAGESEEFTIAYDEPLTKANQFRPALMGLLAKARQAKESGDQADKP
jgi:putative heme iron utilization protein